MAASRSPPRPSPASVAYSDDDAASAVKPPLPEDDDTASTCTEKLSELGESLEASDEESSDDDSLDLPLPPPTSITPAPTILTSCQKSIRYGRCYCGT